MDLMGMVREDLAFDMARHVDSAVHKFEEAQVSEVLLASPTRMTPKCAVFGI
jgi:tRNA/tmRNA/rRNA uracil-C5-methylase (TrmA/RlmC/RlmD family)